MAEPLRIADCKAMYLDKECGKIAFYLRDFPKVGDLMMAEDFVFPNGKKPVNGEVICCGSCGREFFEQELNHNEAIPNTEAQA